MMNDSANAPELSAVQLAVWQRRYDATTVSFCETAQEQNLVHERMHIFYPKF